MSELIEKIREIRNSKIRLTEWQHNTIDSVEDKIKLRIKINQDQIENVNEIHKLIKV